MSKVKGWSQFIWYPSCIIVAQCLSRNAWSHLYNWYLQLVSFFWHAFLDFHMVGCFSTNFLSSATYMGENRCFSMTHIFERKYQSLQLVSILFLVFIWCHVLASNKIISPLCVIQVHTFVSDSNTNAHF